jgi:hypothetical protein
MDIDSCHSAHWEHISAATQELPGQDPAPDSPPSMGHRTLLNQLIERSRVSESSLAQMAHQIDELRQALVSMANSHPTQGSKPSTIAVGQAADPSNLAPPPTGTRRAGPPGTFRNPVLAPVHRDEATRQFHVSLLCPPYSTSVLALTRLA